MEYVDEVDENNNLTHKSFPKDDFHKLGKWYREVMGFVINTNGEVLIQRRSINKKGKPLEWEVCTGHVSAGELPEDAMIREFKEEIDLNITKKELIPLKITKTKDVLKKGYHYVFSYVYLVKTNKKIEEFHMQKEEVDQIKYIKIEELKKMIQNRQKDLCLLVYEDIPQIIDKILKLSKTKD